MGGHFILSNIIEIGSGGEIFRSFLYGLMSSAHGTFYLEVVLEMSYRKVNYLELCWYILKAWMRHKHHPGKQRNADSAIITMDVTIILQVLTGLMFRLTDCSFAPKGFPR